MEYIEECLSKFQELPESIKNRLGGISSYLKMKKLENIYKISLAFPLLLLAIGELEVDDMPAYLKAKYKLSEREAKEASASLANDIFFPSIDDEEAAPSKSSEKSVFSRDQIENIFSSGLIAMFSRPRNEVNSFNHSVFFEIDRDELLENKLIEKLLNSDEQISKEIITASGVAQKGSISNWIKDFIAENGSDLFDGLALAKYISSDKVSAKLDALEKSNLAKSLKTYRNLVFFPESMEGTPIEEWSVIPIDDNTSLHKQQKNKQGLSQSDAENKKTVFAETMPDLGNSADAYSLQLRQMLSSYSLNSLEYKAIKEELSRLEKKR